MCVFRCIALEFGVMHFFNWLFVNREGNFTMKKRILSLFLVCCIVCSVFAMFPITTNAETVTSGTCGDNLTWTLDDNGTLTISGTGDMWGDSSNWNNNNSIKAVVIQSGVTSIGYRAFSDCVNLTSVSIGNSVTMIGEEAFSFCDSLTSVNIPNSVTTIGDRAFSFCDSLTSANIPDSVTAIGYAAFSDCDSLTSINVSGNNSSFSSVDGNLYNKDKSELIQYAIGKNNSSFSLPDSVTTIGYRAFSRCFSLTSINVSGNNSSFSSVDGNLYNKDKSELIQYAIGKNNSSFSLPGSVTTIGDRAFFCCRGLTSVSIGNSVTTIGDSAFYNCDSLKSVNLGNSVTAFGYMAFAFCDSLTSVNIPNSVTTIGERAFYSCRGLTSVSIGNNVTTIGERAFDFCDSLTSVNIPNSVTTICERAFARCCSLMSVNIPNSVTTICERAFDFCDSLTDVYYGGSKAQWDKIMINYGNDFLTNAAIHYNHKPSAVDKNKYNSASTGKNAPVIKSAVLKSGRKNIDILKTTVNIDTAKDNKQYDIKLDIDWKNSRPENHSVYLTQGINGESSQFMQYTGATDTIHVNLGKLFEPNKPIYIIAVDKSNKALCSSTIATKLNIIGKTDDEVFEASKKGEFDFKIGKDIKFTIPDDAPIVGGMELSWKLDFIPVTVAYSDDDTMSIAIGIKDLVTEEKDGTIKFKDFDFDSYKSAIDDYNKNISGAYKKSTRSLAQLRNDARMKQAAKLKKPLSMSMWGGNVLKSTGSGDSDFGIDCNGYAEIKRDKKGNWDYNNVHGYINFEIKISYTYEGQVFIYTIPCYYTIGGELGAGLEANIYKFDVKNFRPIFSGTNQESDDKDPTGLYFNSHAKLTLGAGVGVPHVATFGATGEGALNLKMGLSDEVAEYLRVFLTAKAGYELTFLGKKLSSKDDIVSLDKDNGIIYSTFPNDKDKSWIKPKAASLMSLNDLYDGYSAENVYDTEVRSYNADTEWHAGEPQIALMSADYSNKNQTLLAENIYPNAQPQITDINGTRVLIYTADNTERTAENRQMLVYSVYDSANDTWSAPVPVCDDGTADFYPCISDKYLVWQNQKSVMQEGLSLAEIGAMAEICIAKWNGGGFDAPTVLTDNAELDTLPRVTQNGGEVSVVWIKNSANDILGAEGKSSLVKRTYSGEWSGESVIKDGLNAVCDLSIGYRDNQLYVSYIHDCDGNIATITDREIYLIGSEEAQVTQNEVLDSNIVIDSGRLYWYSENNINYRDLDGDTVGRVFDGERYSLCESFSVSENGGNIAILWSCPTENGAQIKGVLYKDGAWGEVIDVTASDDFSKYPTCVLAQDGSILSAYTTESGNSTALNTLSLVPSYDIEIGAVDFIESNIQTNAKNEFNITVKNSGELPIDGYQITVYNGDGTENNTITFNETLKAGEEKTQTASFITGDTISKEKLSVTASILTGEEYKADNNSAQFEIGHADIAISEINSYEFLPTSVAETVVENRGYSAAESIVAEFHAESEDGEIVDTKTIDVLNPGETQTIAFEYNPKDYANTRWYVVLKSDVEDFSLGNNSDYFVNECATSESAEYVGKIISVSCNENVLSINAYVANNTSKPLNAQCYASVYNKSGKLKAAAIQEIISLSEYTDTGVDLYIQNYTYEDSDYVKLFLWKKDTLCPLTDGDLAHCLSAKTNYLGENRIK